jgi:uncharacterized protein (TIGR03437 family)
MIFPFFLFFDFSIVIYPTGSGPQLSLSPTSGAPGSIVVISGSNFGTTQGTVLLNNSAASILQWSSSTIVFLVPAGATAGSVPVTVTVGGSSSSAQFTVIATTCS